MLASIYARVSDRHQAEKELPIAGQIGACKRHCDERAWEVVGTWTDEAIPGTVWPRDGLQGLIEAIEPRGVQRVVMWDGDRLSRDTDLTGHLRFLIRQAGAEIVAITQDGITPLERDVRTAIGSEFLRKLRQDVMRGLAMKAERCEYTGGQDAYGYRWESENGKKAKTVRRIVPEEASVIQRIYDLADPGGRCEKLTRIARQLSFTRERVRDILRNPVYGGAYTYGRRRFKGHVSSWRPRSEWTVHWDAHEAIIDRGQWERIQERLDENAGRLRIDNHGRATLALTGLMVCGACGQAMRVVASHKSPVRGQAYYYACDGNMPPSRCEKRVRTVLACEAPRLAAYGWTEAILGRILQELMRRDFAEILARELNRAYRRGKREGHTEAEIKQLTRAGDNLLAVIRSEIVTDTTRLAREYEHVQQQLGRAQAALRKQQRATKRLFTARGIQKRLAPLCTDLEAASSLPGLDKAARPLMHRLIESITVRPDRTSAEIRMRYDTLIPAELLLVADDLDRQKKAGTLTIVMVAA
ncbi:MAG: recombinase family protein [Chloroflexi bacterium]|nr:recombinase family protein [Chloroflexota bacterium]